MTMHFSFGSGRGKSGGGGGSGGRPEDERPFRILVIGDFSGRSSRGVVEPLAGRAAHKVDLDALDALPGMLGTRVRLSTQSAVEIAVGSIDDLHPDAIYDNAEVFAVLRDLRARVGDPRRFERAAEEIRGWAESRGPSAEIEAKPGGGGTPETEFASMLGGALGAQPGREAQSVDALIRAMIGPYIVPDRDPRQDELIGVVEDAMSREMRAVLHCPAWQGVESSWRSLQMLVTGLELDETLELFMLDAGIEEIRAGAGGLEHALITGPLQTAGGVPWAAVVHLRAHGAEDVGALGSLGALCHRAGAPLLTGVSADLIGAGEFSGTVDPSLWGPPAEAFADLRDAPGAEAICVAAPGFLLRLPYGKGRDRIERFAFEETEAAPSHGSLLWGCGGVLVTLLLGRAFTEAGWDFEPAGAGMIDDLPVLTLDGGRGMYPCAEAWISDRAAGALAERGATALLSVQNRGAVQVGGIRSLAGGALACRW